MHSRVRTTIRNAWQRAQLQGRQARQGRRAVLQVLQGRPPQLQGRYCWSANTPGAERSSCCRGAHCCRVTTGGERRCHARNATAAVARLVGAPTPSLTGWLTSNPGVLAGKNSRCAILEFSANRVACRGAGSNGRGRGRGDARARASGAGFLLEPVGGIQLNEINKRDSETNTHVRNACIRARARA